MSRTDTYPQHVVTAVIVAHDGAAWLPRVIDGLLGQTRPVQRVVAVDTGSRDRSGSVLAAKLGQGVVFGMDRTTGYGSAIARALQHRAANTTVPGQPAAPGPYRDGSAQDPRVEWIWLLHDDCEPAADALEQLLRGAAETPNAAVLGPKVMDWSDRDVILEAGLTIDTVGRRITGIEPREVDQGQHDGDRDTLAVGSAGMLVRRDVWEQTRGFDTSMGLFREDIDFCWRVHAAGYRVRAITDAVVFHRQAAARRRREVSAGRRPQLLDRRNALLTLAGNLPLRPMLWSLAGNTLVSLLRALFFLVAKRVTAAADEAAALASVLGHPLRLRRVRKTRARGRRAAYGRLRADLPPGRSFRRVAEFIAAMFASAQQDTAGSHHATEDPADDDFLLTDSGLVQRVLTSPSVLLLLGLLIVTGVAERSLLGAGTLAGGALLPAADGAAGLWREYVQGFHPTGIGSSTIAPPYLAVMGALATVLLGKAWLAVDVLLLGCVPIAGMAAFLAARRVTTSVPVRLWAAAAYALLPVATGAIAAGRLGTAVAFALIPVIGLLAGRMFSQPPRIARRAAWATGLAMALGTAFVPLLWPVALLGALLAALALRHRGQAVLRNLAIVVIVPPVLLIPWTLHLATHPAELLLEVGVRQAGLASPSLPPRSLLLLSPGGPGLPPVWVTAGIVLVALVALAASRRRALILAGWTVAVLSLLIAALVSQVSVRPSPGGPAVTAWPGVALAISAAGLLLAAAAGGDSLAAAVSRGRTGLRRAASARGLAVAVLVLAAASAPILAGGLWLLHGVRGPVGPAGGPVVPALVTVSANRGVQPRTLVLRAAGSHVTFTLLRGSGPSLGDGDLTPPPAAARALGAAAAALVAPAGGDAINQVQVLDRFDVGFVLMRAPVDQALARTLDGVPGLRQVSVTSSSALWRLTSAPSRVAVVEPGGTVVPVPSGPASVSGATAPAAGGILTIAEPAGGWGATLNGHPLASAPSPAGSWAQAFRLPAGGGALSVSRSDLGHTLSIVFELLAVCVVGVLALPGVRSVTEARAAADGAPADATSATGAVRADPAGARPAEHDSVRTGDGSGYDEPADDAAADRVLAGAGGGGTMAPGGAAAGAAAGGLLTVDRSDAAAGVGVAVGSVASGGTGSAARGSAALADATAADGSIGRVPAPGSHGGGSHAGGSHAGGSHAGGSRSTGSRAGSPGRRASQLAEEPDAGLADDDSSRRGQGRSRGLRRRGRRSGEEESLASGSPRRRDGSGSGRGAPEFGAEAGLTAAQAAQLAASEAARRLGSGRRELETAGSAGPGYRSGSYDSRSHASPSRDSSEPGGADDGAPDDSSAGYGSTSDGSVGYGSAGDGSASDGGASDGGAGYGSPGHVDGAALAGPSAGDVRSDTTAFRRPTDDSGSGYDSGSGSERASEYGPSGYSDGPGYDRPGYDRVSASESGSGPGSGVGSGRSSGYGAGEPTAWRPARQSGVRSPTGAWPAPDDVRPPRPTVPSGRSAAGSYGPDADVPDADGLDVLGSDAYHSGGYPPGADDVPAADSGAYGSQKYGSGGDGSDAYRSGGPGSGGYGSVGPGSGGDGAAGYGSGGDGAAGYGSGGDGAAGYGSGGDGWVGPGSGGDGAAGNGSGGYGSAGNGSGGYGSAGDRSGGYGSRPPVPGPAAPGAPRPDSPRLDSGHLDASRYAPGPRDPAGQELERPDPGWPETRWPDPSRPVGPAAESSGWSRPPASSWPTQEQASSWPSPDQASWPGATPAATRPSGQWPSGAWPPAADAPGTPGWDNADDSLEPLPSGELPSGPPGPDPAQRPRRWPAPAPGDGDQRDERDGRDAR